MAESSVKFRKGQKVVWTGSVKKDYQYYTWDDFCKAMPNN